MKVTLTRVSRTEKEIQGRSVPTVGIQTKEHGDKWLNTFKTQGTEQWYEGQQVDIVVTEKKTDKGTYLNFTVEQPIDPRIEERLSKLEKEVFKGNFAKAVDHAYTDFQQPDF